MIKEINIWNNSFVEEINDIEKNNATISCILLNFLNENTFHKDAFLYDVVAIAKKYNIKIILLTSYSQDINTHQPIVEFLKSNTVFIEWPLYFLTRTLVYMRNSNHLNLKNGYDLTNVQITDGIFDYVYISLNNITKNHRCEMMDQLAAHDLIGCGAISWHDIIREIPDITEMASQYIKYPFKYWTPKIMLLDQNRNISNGEFIQELIPLEYKKSFCQIVTETEENDFFLTEKTSVPLFFCKPFLVVGSKNFHKTLENFGFKLYDEIFDYSFDSLETYQERCNGIAKNILKLKGMSDEEMRVLYLKITDKLLYNRRLAIDIATDKFSDQFIKFIDEYYNQLTIKNPIKDMIDAAKEGIKYE